VTVCSAEDKIAVLPDLPLELDCSMTDITYISTKFYAIRYYHPHDRHSPLDIFKRLANLDVLARLDIVSIGLVVLNEDQTPTEMLSFHRKLRRVVIAAREGNDKD
jgi:hypothetical protein